MLISRDGFKVTNGITNNGLLLRGNLENHLQSDRYSISLNSFRFGDYKFNKTYFIPLGNYKTYSLSILNNSGLWTKDEIELRNFTTLDRDVYQINFNAYKKFLVIFDIENNDVENPVFTIKGYPDYRIQTDGYVQLELSENTNFLTGVRKNSEECIINLTKTEVFDEDSNVRD